jgi:hypothetical protein
VGWAGGMRDEYLLHGPARTFSCHKEWISPWKAVCNDCLMNTSHTVHLILHFFFGSIFVIFKCSPVCQTCLLIVANPSTFDKRSSPVAGKRNIYVENIPQVEPEQELTFRLKHPDPNKSGETKKGKKREPYVKPKRYRVRA